MRINELSTHLASFDYIRYVPSSHAKQSTLGANTVSAGLIKSSYEYDEGVSICSIMLSLE